MDCPGLDLQEFSFNAKTPDGKIHCPLFRLTPIGGWVASKPPIQTTNQNFADGQEVKRYQGSGWLCSPEDRHALPAPNELWVPFPTAVLVSLAPARSLLRDMDMVPLRQVLRCFFVFNLSKKSKIPGVLENHSRGYRLPNLCLDRGIPTTAMD